MSSLHLVRFLLIIISLVSCKGGWVFTDIDYQRVLKIHSEYSDQNDNDAVPSEEDIKKLKLGIIYPGTKWCGPGNNAENYDDLGTEKATDMCCRQHDLCPDLLLGGETNHNLTNPVIYTRLNCECDETFRKCLHNANSPVAENIGVIYFNAIGTQCYRLDFPVTGCRRRGGWFYKKCVKYAYDMKGDKLYQWFDVPNY